MRLFGPTPNSPLQSSVIPPYWLPSERPLAPEPLLSYPLDERVVQPPARLGILLGVFALSSVWRWFWR